jgi:phosphoglycolate phosphatase
VVTNNFTVAARQLVESLGVVDQLDGVCGSDLVQVGKPAPDLALYACKDLGVGPVETVMVGDGHVDFEMARAAGLGRVIGVGAREGSRSALEPHVDAVVTTVDELDAAAA